MANVKIIYYRKYSGSDYCTESHVRFVIFLCCHIQVLSCFTWETVKNWAKLWQSSSLIRYNFVNKNVIALELWPLLHQEKLKLYQVLKSNHANMCQWWNIYKSIRSDAVFFSILWHNTLVILLIIQELFEFGEELRHGGDTGNHSTEGCHSYLPRFTPVF